MILFHIRVDYNDIHIVIPALDLPFDSNHSPQLSKLVGDTTEAQTGNDTEQNASTCVPNHINLFLIVENTITGLKKRVFEILAE